MTSKPLQGEDRFARADNSLHPSLELLTNFVCGRVHDTDSANEIERHLEHCLHCQQLALQSDKSGFEKRLYEHLNPADELAGLRDDYELLEELGRGGAGIVYRARHRALARDVAFKMLVSGTRATGRELSRFRREAQSLAQLTHPNIVAVFDSGEQDGVPYLAMEFVDNADLATLLNRGPLDVTVATRLVRDLAEAIDYAHQQGILHRDLKPQNVLLQKRRQDETFDNRRAQSEDLFPKLVDFGLARFTRDPESHTRTGDFLGTPEYIAPEMISCCGDESNVAVDVYGLGAILYECLTGRPPFQGSSIPEITSRVLNEQPLPIRMLRPHVPVELQTICLRCLHKSPAQRFGSANDLAADLKRFLAGQPIVSRPQTLIECVTRWCGRNPWRATTLGVLVLVAAAIPVATMYHMGQLKSQMRVSQANYEATRASLWQVLHRTEVADNTIPRLLEMSLSQAKDARDLFARLAIVEGTPRATLDLAKAHIMVGSLAVSLGELAEADIELGAAEALCEKLKSTANYLDALDLLAQSKTKLACSHMEKDQETALKNQLAALAIHQQLADLQPDNWDRLADVAWSRHNLGSIYLLLGQSKDAQYQFQHAIDIRVSLETNSSINVSRGLAGTYSNLALLQSKAGDATAAERSYVEALKRFDQIRETESDSISFLGDWSGAVLNYATMIGNSGRMAESLEICTKVVDVLREAVRREPKFAVTRSNLFMLLATRAQLNTSLEQFEKSANDWTEAQLYADDPYWKNLMPVYAAAELAKSTKYMQAVEMAECIESTGRSPNERLNLASIWAVAATTASRDNDQNALQRPELIETLCRQAILRAVSDLTVLSQAELAPAKKADMLALLGELPWSFAKEHVEPALWDQLEQVLR